MDTESKSHRMESECQEAVKREKEMEKQLLVEQHKNHILEETLDQLRAEHSQLKVSGNDMRYILMKFGRKLYLCPLYTIVRVYVFHLPRIHSIFKGNNLIVRDNCITEPVGAGDTRPPSESRRIGLSCKAAKDQ